MDGIITAINSPLAIKLISTGIGIAIGALAAHKLTVMEIPAHNHKSVSGYTNSALPDYFGESTENFGISIANTDSTTFLTSSTVGGDGTHNNMPPYLAVYMWQRTA